MTIRSRPILDRRHRPRWQDERRTQQLTIVGFAVAIALAIGIFGAAAWNGYWETHLRPVAAVEGRTFSRSELQDRERIIRAEIAAQGTELSLQLTGGPRDQLINQQLESLGQSIQQAASTAVQSLVDQAVLEARAADFGITVSPEDVSAAVTERMTKPERVRASLILINPLPDDAEADAEPTEEQLAAAREEAEAALERIEGGEEFPAVAEEVSDDFTASAGGELGWFTADDFSYGDYFEELEDADVEEIVGPIETDDGIVILRLTGRREETAEGGLSSLLEQNGISDAQYRDFVAGAVLVDRYEEYFADEVVTSPAEQRHVAEIVIRPVQGEPVPQERARHILIQPDPELDDQAEATDEEWEAARQEAEEVLALVRNPDADWFVIAEEHSDDQGSASRGGDLGWYDPEAPRFVEEFAEALDGLELGEITSEPVRTDFGWHIIQKTGERESPEAQAEQLVERLREEPGLFGPTAQAASEDYANAPDGGDLGWIARWQLERPLEEAVFALTETGEISDPIADASGALHIFGLLETSDSEEIDEDRLEQIRTNGVDRWLNEVVRDPVDIWVDPALGAAASAV